MFVAYTPADASADRCLCRWWLLLRPVQELIEDKVHILTYRTNADDAPHLK